MPAGTGVFGPYKRGSRFRVIVRGTPGPDGRSEANSRSFTSEQAALDWKADIASAFVEKKGGHRSVGDAIELYERHLDAEGYLQARETIRRLRSFFASDLETPIGDLTPQACARLYDAATKRKATYWRSVDGKRARVDLDRPVSVNTHRGELTHSKTFLGWCLKRGWLRNNPLAGVEPRGKLRHGKAQLRIDEAARFSRAATTLARKSPEDLAGAAAALVALYMGLRATEITHRQVRDLDDGGRLLWIDVRVKTEASKRARPVPRVIQPLLSKLAKGKAGDDPLFGRDKRGRLHTRSFPLFWVKRVCGLAGVPLISTHGLRGTNASIAAQAGAPPDLVAAALGHASKAITLGSYIAPGVAEQAQRGTASAVLERAGRRQKR